MDAYATSITEKVQLFGQFSDYTHVTELVCEEKICLFIQNSCLFGVNLQADSPGSVQLILDRVHSVAQISEEEHEYFIASDEGEVSIIKIITSFTDGNPFVVELIRDNIIQTSVISLQYYKERQLLIASDERHHKVFRFPVSRAENIGSQYKDAYFLLSCTLAGGLLSIWGDSEYPFLVTAGDSSLISLSVLFKTEVCAEEQYTCTTNQQSSLILDPLRRFSPKARHKHWITALSQSKSCAVWCASGDAAGVVVVWRTANAAKDDEHLEYFMKSALICDSKKVSSIFFFPTDNVFWVGDASGAITAAYLSPQNKSLTAMRRLFLFDVGCGPSYIHSLSNLTGINGLSRLRAFSPSAGSLIEATLHDSVDTLFRVCLQPAMENDPFCGSTPVSTAAIDACCLLPSLQVLVTATSGKNLFFWNLLNGELQHSIMLEENFGRVLASHEFERRQNITLNSSSSPVASIALGCSNGRVCVVLIFDDSPHQQRDQAPKITLKGSSKIGHSNHAARSFDILDAVIDRTPKRDDADGGQGSPSDWQEAQADREADGDDSGTGPDSSSDGNSDLEELSGSHEMAPEEAEGADGENGRSRFTHNAAWSILASPLPVSDLFYSSRGNFLAVVLMRRIMAVYRCAYAGEVKLMAKIRFNEMISDISAAIATAATPEDESLGRHDFGKIEEEEESLVLTIVFASNRVKVLDALSGSIVSEFCTQSTASATVCSAMWDVSTLVHEQAEPMNTFSTTIDRTFAGLFVTQGLQISLVDNRHASLQVGKECSIKSDVSHRLRPCPLHDQHCRAPALGQSHQTQQRYHPQRLFSSLDCLVRGVCLQDLESFSPIATVWSTRRIALLRMHLLLADQAQMTEGGDTGNAEADLGGGQADLLRVLRVQEYYLTRDVRVVYSSALPRVPGKPHRAVIVLSDGYAMLVHLT